MPGLSIFRQNSRWTESIICLDWQYLVVDLMLSLSTDGKQKQKQKKTCMCYICKMFYLFFIQLWKRSLICTHLNLTFSNDSFDNDVKAVKKVWGYMRFNR